MVKTSSIVLYGELYNNNEEGTSICCTVGSVLTCTFSWLLLSIQLRSIFTHATKQRVITHLKFPLCLWKIWRCIVYLKTSLLTVIFISRHIPLQDCYFCSWEFGLRPESGVSVCAEEEKQASRQHYNNGQVSVWPTAALFDNTLAVGGSQAIVCPKTKAGFVTCG